MYKVVPKRTIKRIENMGEDEDMKLMLELAKESDDELWRELILLHLDDMKILNSEDREKNRKEIRSELMIYDIDYEIYKYINKKADQYVEFDDLLKQNHLTIEEAKRKIKQFKEKFYSLLAKYTIGSQNLVVTCYDLMKRIEQQFDNPDLQYLYLCIMTDFGVLNTYDYDDEQVVRSYLRHHELIQELTKFLKSKSENSRKLHELKEYLKKPIKVKNTEYAEESDLLYHLTIQHTFLYESMGNEIYRDNLNSLLIYKQR